MPAARFPAPAARPSGVGTDLDVAALAAGPADGRRADQAFRIFAFIAGLSVLAILVLIAVSTTREAWPAFVAEGSGFVLSSNWDPNSNQFGALAFIYGTLFVSFIALVLAVPVSIGIALHVNEVAPVRLRRPAIYAIDLLAAIPSVVYGLWGVLVFAPAMQGVYERISASIGSWPIVGTFVGGPANGKSYMTAGIILAIMITPIITSLSREVFATVPQHQREAAYGLGATRWETIRFAVMPWARGGIVGATMLGLGRAMGETIAAALVIGASPQITLSLFSSGDAMATVIANQFGEASGTHRAALIGLGVVLFGLTIAVNMSARVIVNRLSRRGEGR